MRNPKKNFVKLFDYKTGEYFSNEEYLVLECRLKNHSNCGRARIMSTFTFEIEFQDGKTVWRGGYKTKKRLKSGLINYFLNKWNLDKNDAIIHALRNIDDIPFMACILNMFTCDRPYQVKAIRVFTQQEKTFVAFINDKQFITFDDSWYILTKLRNLIPWQTIEIGYFPAKGENNG